MLVRLIDVLRLAVALYLGSLYCFEDDLNCNCPKRSLHNVMCVHVYISSYFTFFFYCVLNSSFV